MRPGNNRCTSCKAKRPDVWLRSRWSRADRELVQRLLCGALTVRADAVIPHGTMGGYTNHDCRCDACRAAMAAYHAGRYRAPWFADLERSANV